METFIISNESILRIACFLMAAGLFTFFEKLFPRRELQTPQKKRWFRNFFLMFLNMAIVRFVVPLLAIEFAIICEQNSWGLFNQLEAGHTMSIVLSFIMLDFIVYLQHVAFHNLPLLWRIHAVHHTDIDYDYTTGIRFHPIEILALILIKFGAVYLIGPPVVAVILFEILLSASRMFSHSNIKINLKADHILRWIIVTPDMHRIHHSTIKKEYNSNYGFLFSVWDRAFETYLPLPKNGQTAMALGLKEYREDEDLTVGRLLIFPFGSRITD